ncbi:Phenylacrylic acid decarboxylase [Pestalotiopsis fici W106-1]|uniref:Flavin prenyltransferase PAD1, mitochondrial n=1 Tax=Pestalotiopsis fici (strain W106-1 / CGMCC3.15140) TaxID=1229662 RepID=W3WTR2_PESFW|nr:Phenylacrylic acid decarboxylase [Pestalotiopsis fici W106-1]ETS77230.1 Phenylacrylic acid decarboxylase [Pestalotiopsis fici W106-1]
MSTTTLNEVAVVQPNNQLRETPKRRKRIIVALTGATGTVLGIQTLIALRRLNVETHLIVSKWADNTLKYETDYTPSSVRALADHVYSNHDMAARIASGSFRVDHGMIVVPCSMKTLAAVSAGYCDDLIARAADVVLKERRRLVLVTRECPLSGIHLQNMLTATQNGAVIFPPVPAFYIRPSSVNDLVNHTVGRVLDLFDLDTEQFDRWEGFQKAER